MKNLLFIIFILIIDSCNSDDNESKGLLLINNSSSDVYFYTSPDLNIGHYPDTLLPPIRPNGFQFIQAYGSSGKFVNPDWNGIYSDLPSNKFTMYVLSVDVVDNTAWNIVRDNYLVLERFDITQDDLAASDYTIEYVGD